MFLSNVDWAFQNAQQNPCFIASMNKPKRHYWRTVTACNLYFCLGKTVTLTLRGDKLRGRGVIQTPVGVDNCQSSGKTVGTVRSPSSRLCTTAAAWLQFLQCKSQIPQPLNTIFHDYQWSNCSLAAKTFTFAKEHCLSTGDIENVRVQRLNLL